jgi:MerR family transcriptional regulator, thiopeptide resistance regulator
MTALLLGYEDLEAARRFFLDALGFEDDWEVRDDEGRLTRSHVRFGDTVLMLDKPGAHGVKSPAAVGGLTHLVVINVDNVDAHHDRAAAAGATILVPPTDRPWGRDYELRDPEGYVFSFIS